MLSSNMVQLFYPPAARPCHVHLSKGIRRQGKTDRKEMERVMKEWVGWKEMGRMISGYVPRYIVPRITGHLP